MKILGVGEFNKRDLSKTLEGLTGAKSKYWQKRMDKVNKRWRNVKKNIGVNNG